MIARACPFLIAAVVGCAVPAPAPAAAATPTLGSPLLAGAVHARGIGTAHPHRFDVGGFPAFQKLHWSHWGASTASARGLTVPDGPFRPSAVGVRASDLGPCDGRRAYRRVRARYRTRHHWSRWQTLGTYGTAAAAPKIFCADERTPPAGPAAVSQLLFWANGAVTGLPLDGTKPTPIAMTGADQEITGLDATATQVLWTVSAPGGTGAGIYSTDRNGANAKLIVSSSTQDLSDGVIVGNDYYWLTPTAIARVALDGTGLDENAIPLPPSDPALSAAYGLATDGQYLYFASCGNEAIGRVGLDGSDLDAQFVSVGECVQDVAINRSHIYWPRLSIDPSSPPAIGRAALDGSGVDPDWVTVSGGGDGGVFSVAADDRHVFFVTNDDNADGAKGYIGRVNANGTGLIPRLVTEAVLQLPLSTAP